MVITASAARTNSSFKGLGNSLDRSMPHSSIAATTAGLIWSPGSLPAERTWTLPLAWWSRRAAAIWLRPALWTQTNSWSRNGMGLPPWGTAAGPVAVAVGLDQAGLAEHPEVVADQRLSGGQLLGQVGNAQLLGGQQLHDAPTQRVAQGSGQLHREGFGRRRRDSRRDSGSHL